MQKVPKRTRIAPFCMPKVSKRSKSLPNIVLGQMEAIRSVRAINSSDVQCAKQCIHVPKHQFCFDFRGLDIQLLQNTIKHHLGPKAEDCNCPLRKPHFEIHCYEALHPSAETDPFRSGLHAEGTETLQITSSHRFGSNGGYSECSGD